MIHPEGDDPFAIPPEDRDPARRFRGRLVAPVTAWTAFDEVGAPIGITVASVMVAEGDPATVLGLLDPLSEFWAQLSASARKRFVVHVLDEDKRRVADQFAGRYPGPDARFEGVAVTASEWGPVLDAAGTRAYCSVVDAVEVSELALVVRAVVERLEFAADPVEPLAWFRGAYHGVRPRRQRGS